MQNCECYQKFRVNLSVAVVAMTTNKTHHLPDGTTTEVRQAKQNNDNETTIEVKEG